jgi:hypothetical protein
VQTLPHEPSSRSIDLSPIREEDSILEDDDPVDVAVTGARDMGSVEPPIMAGKEEATFATKTETQNAWVKADTDRGVQAEAAGQEKEIQPDVKAKKKRNRKRGSGNKALQ